MFLVPNRCGVRQWHHPRRSLLVPCVQQWHQWGLLPHWRRTDGCHHFPVLHHVDLSNRGLRVSQTVEARSGSQVPREAQSRGEAPSFCLDIRKWKWWSNTWDTHFKSLPNLHSICLHHGYRRYMLTCIYILCYLLGIFSTLCWQLRSWKGLWENRFPLRMSIRRWGCHGELLCCLCLVAQGLFFPSP